jgi:phosphopantetheinyl transferase
MMTILNHTFYLRERSHCYRGELCFISGSFQELTNQVDVFLHPQEISYLCDLPSEKQQANYLLGRYAAKAAVSHYEAGIPLASIRVESGIFSHPILYSPNKDKMQVSLSHCDQHAVALTFPESHPMGVDLEICIQRANPAIGEHLSSKEKQLLSALQDSYPGKAHILFWTLKEALSKVLRTGLLSSFDIYELQNIDRQSDGSWVTHFKNFPQYQGYSFSLGNLIASIVHPKQTAFNFDVDYFLQEMKRKEFLRDIEDP